MAIPDYQSLMIHVLTAAAAGELKISDVVEQLADKLYLSPDERTELLPSGNQTVFTNHVHWAKTYLNKAGLTDSTRRGYFTITDRGRSVLLANPARIDNAFLTQFDGFRQFKDRYQAGNDRAENQPTDVVSISPDTPDDIMRAAHNQIQIALAQDLLDRIRAAPAAFFERLIVSLLLGMGYGGSAIEAGRALGRSGDDGIDGVVDQDALGLDRVYIQAKRYAQGNNIGSGAIRDFFGSLDRHKATKGLFVTTSSFSLAARETVDFLSKRIVLSDGQGNPPGI